MMLMMLSFVVLALLVSATPVLLFVVLRHQVARLPWPGLWWLGLGTLSVVASLLLAERLL